MSHHKITSLVMRMPRFKSGHRLHSNTAGQAHTDHETDTATQAPFQQSRKQSGTATRIARIVTRTLSALAVVLVGLIVVVNLDAEADANQIVTEKQVEKPQPAAFAPTAGCTATDEWPKGQIPATAQVQPFDQYDRPVTTVSFDEAWTVNHDADKTNDLYVVGLCS